MSTQHFPRLDDTALVPTRDALHAYSRVLGHWLKTCRSKRKHWWHASLRPSLRGLTTGPIHAGLSFELELDVVDSRLRVRTSTGDALVETLRGQPAAELAEHVKQFLVAKGLAPGVGPEGAHNADQTERTQGYSARCAQTLAAAWNSVGASLVELRAGIREETSPIQLWPHHFDLSMLWLPGDKIPGQDVDDEENADKQMNFGFTLGDSVIPEPYLYVTVYPLPDALPELPLPPGTAWNNDGFTGALLSYGTLAKNHNPNAYLQHLWTTLLAAGRAHMTTNDR